MELYQLVDYLCRVLEKMRLRYFVTGSSATIFYGEPRFTNDIDVIVELLESVFLSSAPNFLSQSLT